QAIALGEGGLVERVRRVPCLVEVPLVEGRRVDDEQPARLEVAEVNLEGRRIHGDQAIEPVAGGVDALAAKLELEARHPEQGSRWSPDLGREVREGGEIVAGPRRFGRELLSGQLHTVARIAGESNDGTVEVSSHLPAGNGSCRFTHRRSS